MKHPSAVHLLTFLMCCLLVQAGDEDWEVDRWSGGKPPHLPKILNLEVICSKHQMTVNVEFSGPFQGSVFSKGTYGQDKCIYVNPYSGITRTSFNIPFDGCGTKPDLNGKFYENTIVVQYGTDIIEAWDEAKRLRCEWYDAYEKPAAQNTIQLSDLDVVELNFHGDSIDCWMEIQEGKGPWSREVSGIVPLGSPLTMVIAIKDKDGQFDMRVKSCFAHDGVKPPVHLTDEHGCVLKPKLLSPFMKIRDYNHRASVISYSFFYAFKFPDTMEVHIQCSVEVCRYGCPDTCQKIPPIPRDPSVPAKHPEVQQHYGYQGLPPQQPYYPPAPQPGYPPIQQQQQYFPPAQDFYVPFGQPVLPPPQQQEKKPTFFQYSASASDSKPNSVPPPSDDEKENNSEAKESNISEPETASSQITEHVTQLNGMKHERGHKETSSPKYGDRLSSTDKHPLTTTEEIQHESSTSSDVSIQKGHHDSRSQIHPDIKNSPQASSHRNPQNNYPSGQIKQNHPNRNPQPQHPKNVQQPSQIPAIQQEVTILIPHLVQKPQSHNTEPNRRPQQHNRGQGHDEKPNTSHLQPQITKSVQGGNIEPLPIPQALPAQGVQTIVFGLEVPPPLAHHDIQGNRQQAMIGPGRFGEMPNFHGHQTNIPQNHPQKPPFIPNNNKFQQPPSQQQNGGIQKGPPPPQPTHQQLANQVASVLYKPPPPHYPYPVPQFVPNVAVLNVITDRSDSAAEMLNRHPAPPPSTNIPQPPQQPKPQPMGTRFDFPHGPRSLRIRRDVADGQQFGVSQTFRAIGASDLDFAPNTTMGAATIYKGRREDIVYGVCVPAMTLALGLSILLLLVTCSLCVTGWLLFKYCVTRKKQNGNIKLATILFNGRFQYSCRNRKSNT